MSWQMSDPVANELFIEGTHSDIPALRFRWRPEQAPRVIEVEVVGQGGQLDPIDAPDLTDAPATKAALESVLEQLRVNGALPTDVP